MTFTEWIESLIDQKTRRIQTGLVCKIEKFDSTTLRADVLPLIRYENAYEEETDYPVIPDIPVLVYKQGDYFIKPNYVNGDLVWVGFSTFDIEDALREYIRKESDKTFEIQNACVLGAIVKENYTATTAMQQQGLAMGLLNGVPEPVLKGQTFNTALNTFLTSLGALVGGSVAQNAAAITAIAAAANVLAGQLSTTLSQDVFIT